MAKAKRATQVRFLLSRQLTWAEREALFEAFRNETTIHGHSFEPYGDAFTVFANEDSRFIGQFIHDLISLMFVNVYLKAIRTDFPRVKV